jgi:uncharacterized protein YjbI with pentapeptide repeats
MVQFVKPRTLGLLTKAERRRSGASFIVSALALFDLADPSDFESEQALWIAAAKALPPGAVLDLAMPKPTAEVLIGGHARAPHGEPTTLMQVAVRVGDFESRLAVVGDRVWEAGRGGYAPTPARPFREMPLAQGHAFGGEGHPTNPVGRGYRALPRLLAGEFVALPNIEVPGRMVHAIEDAPAPALFGAMELDSPLRRRFAGTYDRRWVETLAPALPDDADPRLFMHGHAQNWLGGYLSGDEPFGVIGFSDEHPSIAGRLPGMRVRAFLTMVERREALIEIPMVIDTLWLLAGARRGVLVYRGAQPVSDIEGRDVADVVLAYERLADPPRPIGDYAEFRRLRCDPETAQRVALTDGPLVPAKDAGFLHRRSDARRAAAEAEAARQHAAQVFLLERQLREAGVPEALWPAVPPPQPPDVLLPTPEEIAAGDLDLGEVLDAVEAIRRQAEAALQSAEERRAETDTGLSVLAHPDAGPDDVDKVFERLARLGSPVPIKDLDDQMHAAALPPLPDALDPAAATGAAQLLEKGRDWRQLVLAAATPAPRTAAQEAEAALARALQQPEGAPLAAVRDGLETLAGIALADIGDEPAEAARRERSATAPDLRTMLDGLVAEANRLAAPHGDAAVGTAAVEGLIGEILPGLRGAPDPLGALVESLARGHAEPPPASPAAAVEQARASFAEGVAQGRAAVDRAEARLREAQPSIRRLSPTPLFPEQPLSPAAARMFGDRMLAAHRGGLALSGRDLAGIDLAGADLTGADLQNCLLEGASLARARLAGADLTNAVLTGATLDAADLSGCDLSGANLSRASLRRAILAGCTLAGAAFGEVVLDGAVLTRARFRSGTLIKASLAGADLSGATLEEMVFVECDLTGATLSDATVTSAQVLRSQLSAVQADGAVFREATFIDVRAERIALRGARLERCGFLGDVHLASACLDGLEACDTTWNGGDLRASSLRRARLARTMFAASNLGGADFRLVDAPGLRLDDCRLVDADFAAANLRFAQMHRADATGASFRGANLYGCDLTDAVLAGCDLSGSNLSKTVLAMVGSRAG